MRLNRICSYSHERNLNSDVVKYASLLRSCAQKTDLSHGRYIHHHLVQHGYGGDKLLGSLVLNMYIKCGALERAESWFEGMREPNVYSWSFMIGAYGSSENGDMAFQVLQKMIWEGIFPHKVTFASSLSVCCRPHWLVTGKQLHALIIDRGFDSCPKMATALVTMYGKCGNLTNARIVFDRMADRDTISWNAMIAVYGQAGEHQEAINVFHLMQLSGMAPNKSTLASIVDVYSSQGCLVEGSEVYHYVVSVGLDCDIVVGTALANMYGKCGSMLDSLNVFCRISERDAILWNTMIAVCTQCGSHEIAVELFVQMQTEGCIAHHVTCVSIINACASRANVDDGKRMHAFAIWLNFELLAEVGSVLVDMYGKFGDVKQAERVFNKLENRDVFAWTSMIATYSQNGLYKDALSLFHEMEKKGIIPDKVSFVSILPAYASQAQMIEGQTMHATLCKLGLDSDTDVSNALITMYGKCGSMESGHNLFNKMVKRDLVSWNAIIAAYAQHGYGKQVLELYNQMESDGIEPDFITFISVLLACSHAGLLEEGRQCLSSMTKYHNITPTPEHYSCLSDLLARAGQLEEAEKLIKMLGNNPSFSQWVSLLGACRNQVDVERGERAAFEALRLDPDSRSPYLMLSSIYNRAGKL